MSRPPGPAQLTRIRELSQRVFGSTDHVARHYGTPETREHASVVIRALVSMTAGRRESVLREAYDQDTTTEEETMPEFSCTTCGKTYSSQGWLDRHQENEHSEAPTEEPQAELADQTAWKGIKRAGGWHLEDEPQDGAPREIYYIAGLLSTIPFTPAGRHPDELLPWATQLYELAHR
jgi:hypothetical protein